MKKFADIHLKPNLTDKQQTEKTIQKAAKLGYKLVGISLHPKPDIETIDFLQKTCKGYNIDFATRVNLTPKSQNELLKKLGQFRRKFELVSVHCYSKVVARQAAKDHRVDILCFPSINPRERFFDQGEATLAVQGGAALEVDMSSVLACTGFSRARFLSSLRREVAIANRFDIPVVFSSGAVDPLGLRGPYDFASLATLFGVNEVSALDAVSTTPSVIVKRNREKLDPSYVARGVRVVRRGKDCDM